MTQASTNPSSHREFDQTSTSKPASLTARTSLRVAAAAIAACLTVGGFVALADADPEPASPERQSVILRSNNSPEAVYSTVQIIAFDDTIARLDTTDGSIHLIRGNLSNPSTQTTWYEHVEGIRGRTSGILELQHARNATFLVDVVEGRTWLLNRRGSRATWDEVAIARNGARVLRPSTP